MRRRFRNQLVLDLDRGGRRLPWAVAPDDVGLEDLQPPRIRRNQLPLTVFKSLAAALRAPGPHGGKSVPAR
jgi:hypothetical protein